MKIEKSSGNVYRDLGYGDAQFMTIKAGLAYRIGNIIRARGWTQSQAARHLGISQAKVSNILQGKFRGISERKMMELLNKLNRNVKIVISRAKTKSKTGKTTLEWIG